MSREMPNAVSLEQSVLGSLMVYPKVIQDCQELDLHVEEFYLPSHQQIYQAICTIHENGQPIDMNTVVNRLQETDQLSLVKEQIILFVWQTQLFRVQHQDLILKRSKIRRS